ncbi:hybrid sensor histidine kinase/response regulator [Mangrovicella endophytica]|uniref:hybrid sensor histidine kinase/response regulator n=1 Tax=Mangrovicella endophytica TaxID=2066697 RepID=UPI0018E4CBE0|nr:hybrid sensor histidine kinase/response regulator [Mangrovicella endophytica]
MIGRIAPRLANPIAVVVSIGAFVVVAIVAAAIAVAVNRYTIELANAAREIRTLDLLLAQETARSLQSVELVLDNVVDQIKNDGISTPEAFVERQGTLAMNTFLRSRLAGVPQLDAITMISASGKLINFSRSWPVPDVDLTDRDYYRYLRDHATDKPFLSEPVVNRGSGTWTIYLVRRVSAPDGRFVGLVLGAIALEHYQSFYASLELQPGNVISLWRDDGTLLARHPEAFVGQRVQISQVLPPQDSAGLHDLNGVFESDFSVAGITTRRLISSHAVAGFPVFVNVARSKELILAGWRREVIYVGGAIAFAILCVLLLIVALVRQFHAYEAMKSASLEREQAVQAREAAEEALRQAQKMEAVGQLTGGIAHDFNNLLQGITGALSILKRRLTEGRTDNLDRFIDGALRSADRAAALTHRLLAFSRRQPLSPRPVAVNDLLGSMQDLLRGTLGPSISIRLAPAADLWGTVCDANQLENAILNLAVNARDAMPEGGSLTISTANVVLAPGAAGMPAGLPPGDYVQISVADTGSGMPPEVIARAFEPFFTTKELGKGTGLGLSMVYGFVRQSDGFVDIASKQGVGTTLHLYLPRRTAVASSVVAQDHPAWGGRAESRLIAVVDDESAVRDQVVQILGDLGHRTLEAADGTAALALLRRTPSVDLLITDIGMPGLNGRQLVDTIRIERPGLKVIFMTGYAEQATLMPDASGGPVELLTKPFPLDELTRRVGKVLDGGPGPAAAA